MSFYNYLKDKIILIIIDLISILLITGLLFLFNVHLFLIIYIPIINILIGITMMIVDYQTKRNFYKNIEKSLDNLDQKYLLTEIIKEPNFLEGRLFYNTLYDIDKYYHENINLYKALTTEYQEYLELWCHEIKTPLATSKLIIHNNENPITNSIEEELSKIENLIEQILYYGKSGNLEKDYLVKENNLKNIVNNVIKKNKKSLLENKIKINLNNIDYLVNTDSLWLEFILNQIINNAIKYMNKDPFIEITAIKNKNNVILSIKDNGIGINEEDLKKVFNKGYIGKNGRNNSSSTGYGLYLCKKLCDKLSHSITIDSIINEYTTVSIIFPIDSNIKEVI